MWENGHMTENRRFTDVNYHGAELHQRKSYGVQLACSNPKEVMRRGPKACHDCNPNNQSCPQFGLHLDEETSQQ